MSYLSPQMLGAAIPVLALLIPIVAIIAGAVRSSQREAQRHETMRILAQTGQPIPPELLAEGRLDYVHNMVHTVGTTVGPRRRSLARSGAILVGVGAGVSLSLYFAFGDPMLWAWGLIPLCIGIAMLIVGVVDGGKSD